MIKLDDFKKYNFKVTWNALYQGFKGDSILSNQIQPKEIIDYAISLLEAGESNEEVCDLAAANEDNTEDIDKLLYNLSKNEKSNPELEFKKLRVIFVSKKLKEKDDNLINGIMSLGDIWIELNYPEDSPHVFQGRENTISPELYFTQDNYDILYDAHKNWISDETAYIIQNQGAN